MDREHEGGKPGGHSERATAFRGTGQSQCQNAMDYEEEDHRIGGVQEEARQVIPEGVHAPQPVVQAEGHPGQGDVVAQVKRGPHPAELGPAEPSIVRVVEEIFIIVPIHKLISQRGQERSEGHESNERGDKPVNPPPGQRLGHRFMELPLGYTFSPAGLLTAHWSGQARRSLRRGTSGSPLLSSL